MGQSISVQEATISALREENKELRRQKEDLKGRLSRSERQHLLLSLTRIEERASMAAPVTTVLEQTCAELRLEISELRRHGPKTLRSILVMRYLDTVYPLPVRVLLSERFAPTRARLDSHMRHSGTLRTLYPVDLPQLDLDAVLSPEEFDQILTILGPGPSFSRFFEKIQLETCLLCKQPKFQLDLKNSQLNWINEYPARRPSVFICCRRIVCTKCFIEHLIRTVKLNWWPCLTLLPWPSCPVPSCGRALAIQHAAGFQLCLEQNRDPEIEGHMKIVRKALIFRQAMQDLDDPPGPAVVEVAARLHEHLVRENIMFDLFDSRFDPSAIDETGCLPDFDTGSIFRAHIEEASSTVPLFVKFFRRKATAKECKVCAKSKCEIDIGDESAWRKTCSSFKGRWKWDVLVFPTHEIQNCEHDLNVCKACMAEHISSKLKSDGQAVCERLSCPQCDRYLSHREVTYLADEETLKEYEKHLLRIALSKEPNFRWCLRSGCQSGQLYLEPPDDPEIQCEACGFRMCFKDQAPWHSGLSCREWQSLKDHGDPRFGETQRWLSDNTKACPGCSRSIVKDGGCFHMTCTYCHHQFCWQCLADYTRVVSQGRQGHNRGCYFRLTAIDPAGLAGSTLIEALANI